MLDQTQNQVFLAQSAAYQAGYVTGRVAFLVVLAALALKCFLISRRPRTNTKCALSLMFLLCGWLAAGIGAIFNDPLNGNLALTFLFGAVVVTATITSIVFAILGLSEYYRHEEKYNQGTTQAVLSLVLGFLALCVFGLGAYSVVERSRARTPVLANQPTEGQALEFPDLNFRFKTPPPPWVQVNARKFNPASTLAFMRTSPETYFMLIAEKLGGDSDMTLEQLTEISKGRLRSSSTSYQLLEEALFKRNGISGLRMETQANANGDDRFYVHWLVATNGYAYQLVSWGHYKDKLRVRQEAARVLSGFEFIGQPTGSPVESTGADFQSTNFNFKVRLTNSRWRPSARIELSVAGAEFGAVHPDAGGLVVLPVSLFGHNAAPEALLTAMLARMDIAYPNERILHRKSVERGDLKGAEFALERNVNNSDYFYRMRFLTGRGMGYLVAAWSPMDTEESQAILLDALDRVQFTEAPSLLVRENLSERQKLNHGFIFNDIGMYYYRSREFEKSIEFFKAAFQFENSTVYMGNLLSAFDTVERDREALDYLEANWAALADNQRMKAWQAYLEGQVGQTSKAISNYAALFGAGYENDEHFAQYVKLLGRAQEPDAALKEVRKYLEQKDSMPVRLIEAGLYVQKRDFTNAIAILIHEREKSPFDLEVAYALVDAYDQAGQYNDALDLSKKLVKDTDSAQAYFLKGQTEVGLRRYHEAKQDLELALKKSPSHAEARQFLDQVSALLGEGSNSLVKQPLEAVPVPKELLETNLPAPSDSYIQGYDALYLRRLTAISFKKGKEFRTTDYITLKVIEPSGVSKFSTIHWPFEPLNEELYVNQLTVKDAQGHVISTGNPSDFYLVDDTSSGMATHKKTLNMPLSGLQPGHTIELIITARDLGEPEKFRFVQHDFSTAFPVLHSTLFIGGDIGDLKYYSLPTCEVHKTTDGLYWTRNQPVIYRWEPFQESTLDFLPRIWVCDGTSSWDAEAKDYLASIRERMQLEQSQKDQARTLVEGLTNTTQKVTALASYVQSNYTYKAIEFGRRARVPQPTSAIVRNKYGDCKDHALLLSQMLEADGIPAQLALVQSRGMVQKTLPSLDQFDHMIVYVPSWRGGSFIDCTEKALDMSEPVPLGLGGKEAMVLDDKNPRFIPIPDYPAGSSTVSSQRAVRVVNQTDAAVEETVTLTGYHAAHLRHYLRSSQAAMRRDLIYNEINNPKLDLAEAKVDNLEDTRRPLVLRLSYSLKRQFQKVGSQLLGQVPSLWEHHYLAVDPVEPRLTPFQIPVPLVFKSTIEVIAPAGYAVPASDVFTQTLSQAFATCNSTATSVPDGLKIEYRVEMPRGKFAASQYQAFRDTMDKALKPLEQSIALSQK